MLQRFCHQQFQATVSKCFQHFSMLNSALLLIALQLISTLLFFVRSSQGKLNESETTQAHTLDKMKFTRANGNDSFHCKNTIINHIAFRFMHFSFIADEDIRRFLVFFRLVWHVEEQMRIETRSFFILIQSSFWFRFDSPGVSRTEMMVSCQF